MIPRFDYSYSLREAGQALQGLITGRAIPFPNYTSLFGAATVYEVGKARTGIRYALQAFQLGPQARIGIQPYTCSSVMAAIEAAGCHPVFIDIDQHLTLSVTDLKAKVGSLDALIVTHPFGIPADIDQIRKLAGHLPIIEDCAHAFLSTYQHLPLGSFFDVAVFSFGYGKFPVLGSGGLLVVNTPRYDQQIRQQTTAQKSPGFAAEVTFIGRRCLNALVHSRWGYSLGYPWLKGLLKNRNKQAETWADSESRPFRSAQYQFGPGLEKQHRLAQKQRQHADIITHRPDNACYPLPYRVVLSGNGFAVVLITDDRDRLYDYLIAEGIGVGKHFEHAQTWAGAFGYVAGDCPVFEELVNRILTIPCHHTLTERELNRINTTLQAYCQTTSSLRKTGNKHTV